MTLVKGWRLVAYPLSYRVQRLVACEHSPGGNAVWFNVQRFPRTRNKWVDEELDAAASMFERRFCEAVRKKNYLPPERLRIDLGTSFAPQHVKHHLHGWPRWRYCFRILLPVEKLSYYRSWWLWKTRQWKARWVAL